MLTTSSMELPTIHVAMFWTGGPDVPVAPGCLTGIFRWLVPLHGVKAKGFPKIGVPLW